jgi:hypothetical protein
MSQLLAEALQEVQQAESWALQHVPLLNSTQLPSPGIYAHPLWRPAYPTIGKLAWLPKARWANLSAPAHNASAPALPPWVRLHRLRRRCTGSAGASPRASGHCSSCRSRSLRSLHLRRSSQARTSSETTSSA